MGKILSGPGSRSTDKALGRLQAAVARTQRARALKEHIVELEGAAEERNIFAGLLAALAKKYGPFRLSFDDLAPPGAGFRRFHDPTKNGDLVLEYMTPEENEAERQAATRVPETVPETPGSRSGG